MILTAYLLAKLPKKSLPLHGYAAYFFYRFTRIVMNESVSATLRWCRRYITFPLVVAVGYILFVLFFNENSYSRSARLQTEIERLQAEIKENNDTLVHYVRLNERLASDPATLERIVREQYHMQRVNEDVYIIE